MARKKRLPKLHIANHRFKYGEPRVHPVNPPGARYGDLMPKPDSKGKVEAEVSGELIVWDNRQRIPS